MPKTTYPSAGSAELTAFVSDFLSRYAYPEGAKAEFMRLMHRLENEKPFADKIAETVEKYMFFIDGGIEETLQSLAQTAEAYGENEYTLDFVFVLCCLPLLKERYSQKGISEDVFYATCDDLRCKNGECMECKGVAGTFVASWYHGILAMKIFMLGRFEYEIYEYSDEEEYTTACGKILRKGSPLLNLHVPSSGISLTDERRYESYSLAHEFFRDLFPDGKTVFCCNSWLLFPMNKEFLPEGMNIRRFMEDFETASYKIWEPLNDLWRIFGKYADLPADKLPTDTALRRAFAERLCGGGTLGKGFGYIVFDGEKILGKDDASCVR